MANIPLKDIEFPGLGDTYTLTLVDDTLTQSGKAADAKTTGDEISNLNTALDVIDSLTTEYDKTNELIWTSGTTWGNDPSNHGLEFGIVPLDDYDRVDAQFYFSAESGQFTLKRYSVDDNNNIIEKSTETHNIGDVVTIYDFTTGEYVGISSSTSIYYKSRANVSPAPPLKSAYVSGGKIYYSTPVANGLIGGKYSFYSKGLKVREDVIIQEDLTYDNENLLKLADYLEDTFVNGNGEIVNATGYGAYRCKVKGGKNIIMYFGTNSGDSLMPGSGWNIALKNGDTLLDVVGVGTNMSYDVYSSRKVVKYQLPATCDTLFVTIKTANGYDATNVSILSYGDRLGNLNGTTFVSEIDGALIQDTIARRNRSNLFGKKVTVIGDSITAVTGRAVTNWPAFLAERSGCIVQNLGIEGTGFATSAVGEQQYYLRIQNISQDADIIGVALSFNDIDSQLIHPPLGEVTDTGTASVFGYANDFFEDLLEAFPATPIVCYCQNPWYNRHLGDEKGDKYVSGIKTICNNRGIPFYGEMYFNGSALRPWDSDNCEVYFKSDVNNVVDNVHPNSKGHSIIANHLIGFFEENVSNG